MYDLGWGFAALATAFAVAIAVIKLKNFFAKKFRWLTPEQKALYAFIREQGARGVCNVEIHAAFTVLDFGKFLKDMARLEEAGKIVSVRPPLRVPLQCRFGEDCICMESVDGKVDVIRFRAVAYFPE